MPEEKIDILYSILAHEKPECLLDMINNVIHFNSGYNIKIVINVSLSIRTILDVSRFPPEVIFNHQNKNKIKYTYDILGGHVENFMLCENLNFNNFILLASNCMFFKDMDVTRIENLDCQEPKEYTSNPTNPHFTGMFGTSFIIDVLGYNGIKIYDLHRFHEGAFYTKEQFATIKNFLIDTGIHDCQKTAFIAEETLLPLLEFNFFGKMFPSISLVGGDLESQIKISDSKIGVCVAKPVPREIDCKERVHLREIIKNKA